MANPFVAGEDPTADLPDENTFGKIRDQWNQFLDQPGGRAALLQAGLTLLQPPNFGDNFGSQLGRAIGAGGEALGRVEAANIKESEAQSKEDLRTAQAQLAGAHSEASAARAGTEQAKVGLAQNALELKRQQIQNQMEQNKLQNRVKIGLGYAKYRTFMEGKQADALSKWNQQREIFPDAPKPELPKILSPDEWIAQQEGTMGGAGLPAVGGDGLTDDERVAWNYAQAHPNDPNSALILQHLRQQAQDRQNAGSGR